jgi:GT2 family glycosyltransferase
MRLAVIILNYRTAPITIQALRALVPELRPFPDARVTVVENGSGDGSWEAIGDAIREEGWAPRVTLVASERNRGFAGGVNFALRPLLTDDQPPEYIYLLNSDAFVGPGAVATLLEFLDRNPDVGICGSYVHGIDGHPHETAFRFPSILGEFLARVPLWPFTRMLRRYTITLPIPTAPQAVDWIAGASMMIRRAVFESIGLFDEDFFLYYEETDFCHRARRAGLPTWYLPDSRVAHVGSISTGLQDPTRRRPGYWFDSRRHYLRKHHGSVYLWLSNALWIAGYALGRLRRRLKGLPDEDPPRLLRDFLDHNLPLGGSPTAP